MSQQPQQQQQPTPFSFSVDEALRMAVPSDKEITANFRKAVYFTIVELQSHVKEMQEKIVSIEEELKLKDKEIEKIKAKKA